MSRGLGSAEQSAAVASHRRVVPLVELYFDDVTLRLAIAHFPVQVGGVTYLHTGPLAEVRALSEAEDSLEGMEFQMTGLDLAIVDIAAEAPYRGRIVRLLKAYLNESNQVIGTPIAHFVGRIQSMPITEQNDYATVTIVAEHYEAELTRPMPLRYNDADQQRLYPGDRGCEWAESLTERNVVWPTAALQRARAR